MMQINKLWRFVLGVGLSFILVLAFHYPIVALTAKRSAVSGSSVLGKLPSAPEQPAPLATAQRVPQFPKSQGSAADLRPLPPAPSPPPVATPPPPPANQNPTATQPQPDPTAPVPQTDHPATGTEKPAGNKTADTEAAKIKAQARLQKLAEADRLYLSGQTQEAESLYRQVKAPFSTAVKSMPVVEPILEAALLPPAGQVYWREAEVGTTSNLYTTKAVPLELLVEQYPQFIPAHLRLATLLEQEGQSKAAMAQLEKAAALYPSQPDLQQAIVAIHAQNQEWLLAALRARQFLIFNPDHPQTALFSQLSRQYMERFQSQLRGKIRSNALASAVTGLLGVAVTGNPFMSLSSLQTMTLLMQGESAIGNSASRSLKQQLPLVEDPEVVDYVNQMGQKLALVAGRQEFEYEFQVIKDENLNAFALPGGKIFINAGAIAKTKSEAELAGLLAHEIAHAVLSHGFQLMTQASAIGNVAQLVPYGGVVSSLTVTNYSRAMEREADVLGTQLLVKSGYAADGMRNLMVAMKTQEKKANVQVLPWLSTHPGTQERINYLEGLIQRNNYNRYAFEGVVRHQEIQEQVNTLLAEAKAKQEKPKQSKTKQDKTEQEKPKQEN